MFCGLIQPATSAIPPETLAATLDTGSLAGSYSGGVHTRWSSNHFQFARSRDCHPPVWSSALQFAAAETPIEGGRRSRSRQISHTTAASRATGSSTIPVVSERFMEPDSSAGEIGRAPVAITSNDRIMPSSVPNVDPIMQITTVNAAIVLSPRIRATQSRLLPPGGLSPGGRCGFAFSDVIS